MPSTESSPRSPTYPTISKRAGRSVRLMEDSGSEDEYSPQMEDLGLGHGHKRPGFGSMATSGAGASRLASIVSTSAVPKAQPLPTRSLSYRAPEPVNQGGLTHLLASHPGITQRTSEQSTFTNDLHSDNDDEADTDIGIPRPTLSAASTVDAAEERERLEWRSMLASVLSGDVLRGESSRIGLDKPGDVVFRKKLGQSLWWQIRARLRSRSEVEEKKRTEERRGRVVDAVLEEIEGFKAHFEPEDAYGNRPEHNALEQVTAILSKLDLVEALYPHQAAVRAAKTLFDSPSLQKRVDALTAWSTVVTSLQAQLAVLQKWTGSEDLDVTKPNTTKERALVGKNRYHPLDAKGIAQAQAMDQAADDSTFIERVMKEDNVQKTFQKRVFHDVNVLVLNAKSTVIDFLPVFEELKLPDFRYEIVRLIGFPGRLIIEMLKVRLDAEKKLDKEHPNPIVINDMIYNFRVTISLAVLIKRQYTEIVEPDEEKRWDIPPSLTPDYDTVLLDGLRAFFNLLQMKLKDGDKAIYFRETEVLEDEWEFLCEAAEAVDGGDQVVAQLFCSLTNKLMVRVCRSFQQQLLNRNSGERPTTAAEKRAREEELIAHFGKMLDTARMRYRKLQRFARRLAQRFDNSAEYAFEDDEVEALIEQLQATDHFLVFTSVFEQSGIYVVASGGLWNDPDSVRRLLKSAFSADYVARPGVIMNGKMESDEDADGDTEPAYLVVISPSQSFAWTGGVMTVDLDYLNLELDINRARVVADGPGARFALVKQMFEQAMEEMELECVVQQQAHLPAIQKELAKIARSTYRLSESFISSAAVVHASLRGSVGSQDLIENWYLFASDHGRRVAFQIEDTSLERFSRLLMRLGISWVSFICDSCDPTDRKTFRWTVQALDYALKVTSDQNILHLDSSEFSRLRRSVASLVSLLISHFDILGARSSMEAKREAERIAAMRRLQRLQENVEDDDLAMQKIHTGQDNLDRSIRLVREERLRLIAEVEEKRNGFVNEARLVGQVLDEEVSEDRSLVFLAASSSNIALRWQQGAFIGGGANGNVYMGFNIDSGGVMAVKEIRVQDIHSSPALYKQIKEESDVMSMLSHPHIVEYYGIEVHRDRVYIFEEYCEGGSLANLLEHGRVEDEDVVRVYATQILSGLEYLHSKAVEHRDIKPDNILLSAGSQLKLVDFGAAKVIAKGNKTMARTRAIKQSKAPAGGAGDPGNMMSLAGTPMYMAPEVIRSEKRGRLGSPDIWSMGCVLLEIATGRKPWSNLDNEWAIMFHIGISTQHPPLPEPDQLSEEGIDFIERCLTLDPLERPTATELWHHPWLVSMFGDEGGEDEYIPEEDEGMYDEDGVEQDLGSEVGSNGHTADDAHNEEFDSAQGSVNGLQSSEVSEKDFV